jgi:hypothetical protein
VFMLLRDEKNIFLRNARFLVIDEERLELP